MPKLGKPLVIVAVIAALAGYRMWLIHQRDAARAQAQALTAQVSALKTANQSMEAAVAWQNGQIAELSARAAQAVAVARQQADAAARSGAAAMAQAVAEAKSVSHAQVPESCGGAIAWGVAQGPELGQW
jgi:hypothetical protein